MGFFSRWVLLSVPCRRLLLEVVTRGCDGLSKLLDVKAVNEGLWNDCQNCRGALPFPSLQDNYVMELHVNLDLGFPRTDEK